AGAGRPWPGRASGAFLADHKFRYSEFTSHLLTCKSGLPKLAWPREEGGCHGRQDDMRVQRLLATDGIGGYYWRDQEAIGQGAPRDGFLYRGAPVTPGFASIIQVSSTVLLTGVADDGSELYGDCATVNHAFRSGRQQAP